MNALAKIGCRPCGRTLPQRILRVGESIVPTKAPHTIRISPGLLFFSSYSTDSRLATAKFSAKTGADENFSIADKTKDDRFGRRLGELLRNANQQENDPGSLWHDSGDVFRGSLEELRILRARGERAESALQEQSRKMILDCLVLLDRLSESLPRAEEYSSTWLSAAEGASSSDNVSLMDQILFNEFLKEWMLGWKEEQQQQQQQYHRKQQHPSQRSKRNATLPSPSQMAEKVDRYRSRSLVQPNPTSYNLLLNAMIYDKADRRKAILLADDYLKRLWQAQESTAYEYVDTVSITTIMKGWVDLGQPQTAQEWLDIMMDSGIPPNAVAYSILIHGWAKRGDAHAAESILQKALDYATTTHQNRNDTSQNPLIDRVVFHAVLDAWAVKASKQTPNNSNPSLRAKALVQKMNDLADEHPKLFGHRLRPNDETWHKLIAVVAFSSESKSRRSQEVGPQAAEKLLCEFEETKKDDSQTSTPPILLNRILQAYCSCGTRMHEAEAYYQRRCQQAQTSKPKDRFPNEVTFHNILSGWATAAKVVAKKKSKTAFEIPLRAEAWLETMEEQEKFKLSTRAYGSVLQAWSLSTKHHADAAGRAEDLLRKRVWPMLHTDNPDPELYKGVVICTNICLRAWSNQAAGGHSNSVTSSLRLLSDFLELASKHSLKPTEETFRAVLHAIATPSKIMTPVQKHNHSKVLLACMRERFRLMPSKGDLAKFERLKQRRDAYLAKHKQG